MPVSTALDALSLPPTRLVRSSWPWRSALYLAGGALPGVPAIVLLMRYGIEEPLPVLLAAVSTLVAGTIVFGRLERWRLRLVDNVPLPDAHRPLHRRGWRHTLRVRLYEQVTWREIGFTGISTAVLCWLDAVVLACMVGYPTAALLSPLHERDNRPLATLVSVGMGVGLLAAAPYVVTAWAGARAAMARALLGPRESDRLGEQLVEVTRSRARLVDAFEGERRRIERDLHDGAQQRLVALNVYLGLARLEVPAGSPAHDPLVKAHELARRALSELRELIRGVHPQVLTDRGLAAALQDLAGRSPVPVDVDVRLPGRLPASIEVTAYFVVGEALTNIARHSRASRAAVTAGLHGDRLILRISDDGVGGADQQAGTGLAGLADRVAAVGGTMSLFSPPGGPTLVQAEFPGWCDEG
ncbi:sensor histidine kinase [Micromonospora deserti]|uniref:histidine kinase n=1 Tax=Micromonospora deserti TaxID=2070366 RepID=A0A2W2CQG9_9ACTN|nr:sensor histidine kinase [Micromonospora deserti]PZG01782.1 sensor histidine kinase [Micromonospora deserti]